MEEHRQGGFSNQDGVLSGLNVLIQRQILFSSIRLNTNVNSGVKNGKEEIPLPLQKILKTCLILFISRIPDVSCLHQGDF